MNTPPTLYWHLAQVRNFTMLVRPDGSIDRDYVAGTYPCGHTLALRKRSDNSVEAFRFCPVCEVLEP